MPQTTEKAALNLVRRIPAIRPRDLRNEGIPAGYLHRLWQKGLIMKLDRGLYTISTTEIGEHQSLAEVTKRVPQGVVCLLSALRFHDLTTQAPFEVWIAVDRKAWRPRTTLPVHIVRFSGEALTSGIEEHNISGVTVRVYSPAKTVADCFKYRNKIGLDIALEALRECWRRRLCTIDDIWHYAKVCRVANVMRPYIESLE